MRHVYWMYLLFYLIGSYFGLPRILSVVKGR